MLKEKNIFLIPYGYFAFHSRFYRQGSGIVKKVDLGQNPSTGRVGAPRLCYFSPGRGGRLGPVLEAARSAPHTPPALCPLRLLCSCLHPFALLTKLFLPLECSCPFSLPIEIFPLPQSLSQAPLPLKRPAGNDLSHFNSLKAFFFSIALTGPKVNRAIGHLGSFCMHKSSDFVCTSQPPGGA